VFSHIKVAFSSAILSFYSYISIFRQKTTNRKRGGAGLLFEKKTALLETEATAVREARTVAEDWIKCIIIFLFSVFSANPSVYQNFVIFFSVLSTIIILT